MWCVAVMHRLAVRKKKSNSVSNDIVLAGLYSMLYDLINMKVYETYVQTSTPRPERMDPLFW